MRLYKDTLRIINRHCLLFVSNKNNNKTKRLLSQYVNLNENPLVKNGYLVVNDAIRDAINTNKPIVALESTIITHGLPYPNNYETAIEVENIIRENNAQPATIAFLNGKIKVGLDASEIEQVAKSSANAVKLSRRDLSYVLSSSNRNLVGGTTVSATMIAAEAANIPIFVTGGIGGVHRDFSESLDVSADLYELSKTKVAVLSSGIKSILDIAKTLEYLETLGVCCVALNENGSTEFPAFFTSKSGHHAPYNCKSTTDVARLIQTHFQTGLNSGLLIGVPIPEKHSVNAQLIEDAINQALHNAKKLNIKGKKVTPYLLEELTKLTKGKSLMSNLELIKNNAKVGAQVANQLAIFRNKRNVEMVEDKTTVKITPKASYNQTPLTVIGGINIDFAYKLKDNSTMHHKGVTQPCYFNQTLGGVARNMSETLIRFGLSNTKLISVISDDLAGQYVLEKSKKLGFDTSTWLVLDHQKTTSTGSYCALFDVNGELLYGYGAMDAHDRILPEVIKKYDNVVTNSSICVIDADLPIESLRYIADKCAEHKIPVWYNPTDLRKCTRIIDAHSLSNITYMSPNLKELYTMFSHLYTHRAKLDRVEDDTIKQRLTKYEFNALEDLTHKYKRDLEAIEIKDLKLIIKYMLIYVPFIILSRGCKDMLLASSTKLDINKHKQLPLKNNGISSMRHEWQPQINHFPVIQLKDGENIVNVSGAGDSNTSGIIAGIIKNYDLKMCVYNGLLAAKLALLTHDNVSTQIEHIDDKLLFEIVEKHREYIFTEYL